MYPELHWNLDFIAFGIYPYISLTLLVAGSIYRYRTNPQGWTSESSEILAKKPVMRYGAFLFHYGIILALLGHLGGLFVPQPLYNALGFKEEYHLILAHYSGMAFGWAALAGLVLLTGRRLFTRRVRLTSDPEDFITLALLLIVVSLGTYNVTFARYENILHDVAPWLRSIFVFAPAPELLAPVPLTYKAHFLAVWTLFAFYPFSRLVHITSAPLTYVYRVWILFRKGCEESWG